MKERKQENLVAGIVGAFLGSLLSAVCIILVGQLGYVASICGLVMAVCTMKGYELLGGCLSRKGALVSGFLILVMTFLAYQMELAIEVARLAEVDIFEAFLSLSWLINDTYMDMTTYWGGLAMLYFFTLLGAVPMILAGLRANSATDLPPAEPRHAAQPRPTVGAELHCYGANYAWVRMACITFILPGLVGMLAVLALAIASSSDALPTAPALGAAAAGLICAIAVEAVGIGKGTTVQGTRYVFVRYSGLLWRVDLVRLNMMDTYRFTNRSMQMTVIRWEKLSHEEQERAKRAIQRAIQLLCSGETLPGSVLSYVVQCLPDAQLEKENAWSWKISYRFDQPNSSTKRKTLVIPKAYPKFAPTPGTEPPTGAAPGSWKFFFLSLAVIAAVMAAGWSVGVSFSHSAAVGSFMSGGKNLDEPEEIVPESTVQYADQGFLFQMDAECAQLEDGYYMTQAGDVLYGIIIQTDCSEKDALDVLLAPIGDYRMDPDFDRFAFPGEQKDLLTITAEDGAAYRYNIMSIYFTDGTVLHTAVSLAEDGTLIRLESTHGPQVDEQEVLGHMLYILRHMEQENNGSAPDRAAALQRASNNDSPEEGACLSQELQHPSTLGTLGAGGRGKLNS